MGLREVEASILASPCPAKKLSRNSIGTARESLDRHEPAAPFLEKEFKTIVRWMLQFFA
jgi:hypothetical protein